MVESDIMVMFGMAWGSNMGILLFVLKKSSDTKDCVTKIRTALSAKFPEMTSLLK